MFETIIHSLHTDFKTSVLETVSKLIDVDRARFPLADRPDDMLITPYVIYAGYDPQKIVFRRADFVSMPYHVTENILLETMLLRPRYLAVTMDGVKLLKDTHTEVCSYLLFFFNTSPINQDFGSLIEIMEIEYGQEDGGWMAEPQSVTMSRFEGFLKDRLSIFARLYLALR